MSDGHTQAQKDRDKPTIVLLVKLARATGTDGTGDDVLRGAIAHITALTDRVRGLEGALNGLVELLDAHQWGEGPALRAARAALTPPDPAVVFATAQAALDSLDEGTNIAFTHQDKTYTGEVEVRHGKHRAIVPSAGVAMEHLITWIECDGKTLFGTPPRGYTPTDPANATPTGGGA